MSSAVWFVLFLAQAISPDQLPQRDPRAAAVTQRMVDLAPVSTNTEIQKRMAAYRQRSFEKSFNRLLEKLGDFADSYNRSGAIDMKKVESVKKAWHEVEKNEAWFKESR